MKLTDKKNRRNLLQAAARWGIALAAVLGAAGLYKRNGGGQAENACRDPQGRLGCGTCGLLGSCGLPRGLSFKQFRRERRNGQ